MADWLKMGPVFGSSITLNLALKLFILPILTYCCEPLIAAPSTLIEILDKFQNQALRIITGAVKTIPIDAILVVTKNRFLIIIFQEKALLLWEKIVRIPGSPSFF